MAHLQQNGRRDPRRRRVLADLLFGRASDADRSASSSLGGPASDVPLSNYGDALFLDKQLRVTDLVPRRLGVFVLIFLAGAAVVAGLLAMYVWTLPLASQTSDGSVAAFDLDGEGSLPVWFSSTMLLLASFTALVVYSVRRHKKTDYQGRYRIWIWAAMCWLLLSIDETSSLHEGFMAMMTRLTGTPLFGDGSAWWMIAYFFLLGGIGTRLALDLRECRLSLAVFLSAGACYVLAVIAQLGWFWETETARAIMLEEGAEMAGNLLLVMAMGLHARHVLLDAEGLLPAAKTIAAEEIEEEEDEAEELEAEEAALFGHTIRVNPPRGARKIAPHQPSNAFAPTAGKVDAFTAGMKAAEDQVGRKLTKQEKKALRRRLEKMREERERRSA